MTAGPHGQRYEAYRPVVMGRRGMVCSGHPLASEAGIWTLRSGGNAVDAATAVSAALGVVELQASGIAGDGFIMVYRADASTGDGEPAIDVVNATGPAPLRATRDEYADGIPMKGMRSVSVPGLVDGWLSTHERYGSLPLESCLAPAIALAEEGFPVSHKLAEAIRDDEATLLEFPSSRAVFAPTGRLVAPGEILVQRDLAQTLRILARDGRRAFYEGEIADAILATTERYGGLLTAEDLGSFRARWQSPISTSYRSYEVYESPPNSSGHVLLQELNLIEQLGVSDLECNSADAIHLMVEAKRLAFADRERYMADPEWVDVPMEGLLSKDYAAERARLIQTDRAIGDVVPGDPWPYSGREPVAVPAGGRVTSGEDTTCFAIVDARGNAVCQLQSIQSMMGSGLVAEGTGMLLNNRMTYWHLDPDHADRLEPGKRVRHTMNTVMAFLGGRLVLVNGTPGADTQVQTNLQVLTHVLDHGMSVVEAVEAPRWRHTGRGTESTIPFGEADALELESRFGPDVAADLRARGHPVVEIGPWAAVGSEVAIHVDVERGALHGACDPRRDGYAIGY